MNFSTACSLSFLSSHSCYSFLEVVLGEIQRIKHQQALEYWSQILKEQQENGLCIKAFCRSRQQEYGRPYGTALQDLQRMLRALKDVFLC